MFRLHYPIILLVVSCCATAGSVHNGYNQALQTDPGYFEIQAYASTIKQQERITYDRLKPQVSARAFYDVNKIDGSYTRSGTETEKLHPNLKKQGAAAYASQKLFALSDWEQYKQSSLMTEHAQNEVARYEQDLMLDVAYRYLEVLKQYFIYQSAKSQTKALLEQKHVDKTKFNVGAITKSALLETQARYDSSVAYAISMHNNLADAIDSYTALTHETTPKFMALDEQKIPFQNPKDHPITQKITHMNQYNMRLKSAQTQVQAIQKSIRIAQAGFTPQLELVGAIQYQHQSIHNLNISQTDLDDISDVYGTEKSIGVNISLPIYTGGAVQDAVKLAHNQYNQAVNQLARTQSDLQLALTRTHHHLIADVKKIQALKLAVRSSKSALNAHKEGFKAGTQTNLEVLNAISQLQKTETDYALTRYGYLQNYLKEKHITGQLATADIEALDSILTHKVLKVV